MAFYEPQGWQAPVRQSSWEEPAPPSRSGTSSASQREESNAFATQFEEVDRALDNLVKSGKFYPAPPRRDQMPPMYAMPGPRNHSARHSVGDFRSPARAAANGQNFYASQRYAGRPSEADQMMQAKRRMAAQRERELRNYHQEQQYNRSVMAEMASNKSDRSMSPSTLSEESRRELIARQHRALYGVDNPTFNSMQPFSGQGHMDEPATNTNSSMRVASPRGPDPFGVPIQQPTTDDKATSPSNNSQPSQQQQQQQQQPSTTKVSGQSTTPDSNHSRSMSKSIAAPSNGPMGPIGSRPPPQSQPPNLNKRNTSPLPNPSTFSFGQQLDQNNERQTSNPGNNTQQKDTATATTTTAPSLGAWGAGSGVWSNKIGSSVWS